MIKIDKHIEIVRTNIARYSSLSQKSCDAIFAVLSKHYTRVGVTTVNNLSDLEGLVRMNPNLVFTGTSSIPINDISGESIVLISDYLDEQGIAYTGSGHAAHRLEGDKVLAKQRMIEAGLNTAAFQVARQAQEQTWVEQSFTFPVFIKPSNRGGGAGIDSQSVAHNIYELKSKVQSIANYLQADSLIEEYLTGREFSVAILRDEFTADYLALPIELVAPLDDRGARMLSRRVKSGDMETALAVADRLIRHKVTELAVAAFQALGGRDYGRIDIRLDKNGEPNFLEANLIPSLIKGYGSFPKACLINLGLDYEPMILRIVQLGLSRSSKLDTIVQLPDTLELPVLETAFEADLV